MAMETPQTRRKETTPRMQFQIRAALLEGTPDEGKMILEGRAIVLDQSTVLFNYDGIDYSEIIDKSALAGADMKDVCFKYNHSDHVMIMARTRNKTLTLTPGPEGLDIRAELADTTAGCDLYKLVKRGDIDRMSFAFTVLEESYNQETHTWRILKIKRIYDVAAVDIPAYDSTSISARSDREMEIERMRSLDRDVRRRRLILMARL